MIKVENKKQNELVIFDIDNTIVDGQSQRILLKYLRRKKVVGVVYYMRLYFWFVLYKIGIAKDPRQVLEYAVKFLENRSIGDIKTMVNDFFESTLVKYIFPEAISIMEEHKKNGRKILLVSNAVDVLVREISYRVGADSFIASKLEVQDGVYTGKVSGELVYGSRKCDSLKEYIDEHSDFSLERSWAYADHYTDTELLSSVKHPYAVNPDSKLTVTAQQSGWPLLRFHH